MKASRVEYQFRYLIHTLIYALGFTAPWNHWLHLDPSGANAHTWGILAVNLMQAGVRNIGFAFDLLLILGIGCALTGAFLRTWGTAYLGSAVVQDGGMHTARASTGIIEGGPFRYVRNPLYLGTFLHTLALSLLMPRSGAVFCILAIGLMQVRLIFAEETFLAEKLGAPYAEYKALAPRMLPRLRPRIAAAHVRAAWPQAFLGEIYMWGVALAFAAVGWRYNAMLLIQCVIVSYGVSLLLRAVAGARR